MLVQAIHARKEEPCTHHQAKIKDNKIVISICKNTLVKFFKERKILKRCMQQIMLCLLTFHLVTDVCIYFLPCFFCQGITIENIYHVLYVAYALKHQTNSKPHSSSFFTRQQCPKTSPKCSSVTFTLFSAAAVQRQSNTLLVNFVLQSQR